MLQLREIGMGLHIAIWMQKYTFRNLLSCCLCWNEKLCRYINTLFSVGLLLAKPTKIWTKSIKIANQVTTLTTQYLLCHTFISFPFYFSSFTIRIYDIFTMTFNSFFGFHQNGKWVVCSLIDRITKHLMKTANHIALSF